MITIIRFFIGMLILLPFSFKNLNKFNYIDLFIIFINGNILIFSMLFLQISVFYGNPSFSAILVSTNVIFVKLFSYLFEKKEEKHIILKFIFLLLGVLGIYLFLKTDLKTTNILNIVFGILAALMFGLFTVLNKKFLEKYDQFALNFYLFLGGLIILILLSLLLKKFNFDFIKKININDIFILIYIGVFVTGIAYVLFFYGLKFNSAVDASFIFYFKPFVSYILFCIFFKEKIFLNKFLFIIIVIISIFFYNKIDKLIILYKKFLSIEKI
ncbi:MAG: DMT family transporter [Spirochaetes bacterium]|nr:DMT family transporter [Spirochaetota bacterium]